MLDQKVAMRAAAEVAEAAQPRVFYGVYSDADGESGVYESWEQVSALVWANDADEMGISLTRCDSQEAALRFVREATQKRATGVTEDRSIKGSVTRRSHTPSPPSGLFGR